jgi:hypothetical protein
VARFILVLKSDSEPVCENEPLNFSYPLNGVVITISALLVGLFIRKSAEMVSFLKYVISACDFIFASVVY